MAEIGLEPEPRRWWAGALGALAVAAGMWAFVEWRSAPPAPPVVVMPDTLVR